MADFQELNSKALAVIQQVDGVNFNEALAKQYYLMTTSPKGEPQIYIKKAGLLHKMEQKFGSNVIYQPEIIKGEDYREYKAMQGLKPEEPYFICKCSIWVKGEDKPYFSHGSAWRANCQNGRFLEMAETRAVNRAMRLATNCGFTSQEEVYEPMSEREIEYECKVQQPPKAGDEAKKWKDAFFAKAAEAGINVKVDKGQQVIDFVSVTIGKHPIKETLTIEDYHALIRALDEKIIADEANAGIIDATVIVRCETCNVEITEDRKFSSFEKTGKCLCEACEEKEEK